jgi:peroxiredoxin
MKTIVLLFFTVLMTASISLAQGYQIGDVATDFSLKNVDGKMVSLADFSDAEGYVIIFTCNHCPYAVMYEDRIIALQEKYGNMNFPVIAINPNDPEAQPQDSYELMKERAAEKNFNFPYLFDEGQKIYPKYGATRTPHVFLLDKNRVVKYIGAIDDNPQDANSVNEKYLKNAIKALKENKNPEPATTKAIGCTIKTVKT